MHSFFDLIAPLEARPKKVVFWFSFLYVLLSGSGLLSFEGFPDARPQGKNEKLIKGK
jgi:hypothetical protein